MKIVAFEIEVGGITKVLTNMDEIKAAAKEVATELGKSRFGTAEFDKLNSTMGVLKKTQQEVAQGQRDAQQQFIKTADAGKNSYRALNAELVLLRRSFKELSEEERQRPIGIETVARIQVLDGQLKKIDASIGQYQRNVGNYVGALGQFFQSSGQTVANAVGGQGGNILGQVTGGIGNAGLQALSGNILGGSLALVAAVGTMASEFVKINAQVSDAAANVQKTSGLSQTAINNLVEDLKGLDTRTSLTGLLGIGEVLGQLGVEVDTKTIAAIDKLNVALGDEFGGDTKQIVQEVGKLKTVFTEFAGQDYGDSVLKIGNALNVLSASGASTAPVITDFSTRIAGTTGPLGIAAGQVLGVSATLQELGTNSERGATGFSRVIQEIVKAPEGFEKSLGITKEAVKGVNAEATSFKDLVNRDLFGAFTLVLKRLNELNLSNTDFASTLSDLKITGQGELEVLGKLAQNQDLLTTRVNVASKALGDQSSILNEFSVKNQTLGAELEELGNNITEAFVDSGASSALADIVGGINEWIRGTDDLSDKLIEEQVNINSLVFSIVDMNTKQEDRITLIQQLQAQYPEYFSNLNAETVTNQQLLGVLQQVNQAYAARIAVTQNNEEIQKKNTESAKELNDLERERQKIIKLTAEGLLSLEKALGKTLPRTGVLVTDIQTIKKAAFETGVGDEQEFALALEEMLDRLTVKEKEYQGSLKDRAKQTQGLVDINSRIIGSSNVIDQQQLQNIINTKDQIIAEADLIKQLVQKGRVQEAGVRISKLVQEADKAIKPINLQAVGFVIENTTGQIQALALGAKSSVEIIKQSVKEAEALVKSQTTSESQGLQDGGKSKAKLSPIAIDEDAEKQFAERRRKLEADLAKQLSDARVSTIQDETTRQIEAENNRFTQVLLALQSKNEEREKFEQKALEDLQKSLDKVRARLKERPGDTDALAQEKLLTARISAFKEQSATEEVDFLVKLDNVKVAETEKHSNEILKITQAAEKRRAEALKKGQEAAFKVLEEFFNKEDELIDRRFQDNSKRLERARDNQINSALSTLTGSDLTEKQTAIQLEFDLGNLDGQKTKLLEKLKNLKTEIETANILNGVNRSLGLSPTIADSDLEKLEDQVTKTQEAITDVEDKEAAKRERRSAEENQKKISDQQKFQEEVRDAALNAASQISDALLRIEEIGLEQEKKKKEEALEAEYAKKLKAAKGNVKEEERLNKELAAKKEAIERDAFEQNQDLAVKRALIDGALAIVKAYATLDPVSATIAAAFTAIVTAAQIAVIKEQEFSGGGFTSPIGPKDRTGHRVAGVVHEDEYVVPKRILKTPQGRAYVEALESMRRGGVVFTNDYPGYAEGGFTAALGTVNVILDEQSLNKLAQKVYEATFSGTRQGTALGSDDVNRRDEREDNLTTRTEI